MPERPFYFVPVASDGTQLPPVRVIDDDWREAEAWCYLAIKAYEERKEVGGEQVNEGLEAATEASAGQGSGEPDATQAADG